MSSLRSARSGDTAGSAAADAPFDHCSLFGEDAWTRRPFEFDHGLPDEFGGVDLVTARVSAFAEAKQGRR